jgi:hypothetical protein
VGLNRFLPSQAENTSIHILKRRAYATNWHAFVHSESKVDILRLSHVLIDTVYQLIARSARAKQAECTIVILTREQRDRQGHGK